MPLDLQPLDNQPLDLQPVNSDAPLDIQPLDIKPEQPQGLDLQPLDNVAHATSSTNDESLGQQTKDSWNKWLDTKKYELETGHPVKAIGGGALDVLGLIGRPTQALFSPIESMQKGVPLFSKETARAAADKLLTGEYTDIMEGIKPKTALGEGGKMVVNFAKDLVGVGGLIGKAGKLSKIEGLVNAGQKLNEVEGAWANPYIQKAIGKVGQGANEAAALYQSKVKGNPALAKEIQKSGIFNALNKAAETDEDLRKTMQFWVTDKAGVGETMDRLGGNLEADIRAGQGKAREILGDYIEKAQGASTDTAKQLATDQLNEIKNIPNIIAENQAKGLDRYAGLSDLQSKWLGVVEHQQQQITKLADELARDPHANPDLKDFIINKASNLLDPEKYIPVTYGLKPTTKLASERTAIATGLDDLISSGKLSQEDAALGKTLSDLYKNNASPSKVFIDERLKQYGVNDNAQRKALVDTVVNMGVNSVNKDEALGRLRERIIPEALRPAFAPRQDILSATKGLEEVYRDIATSRLLYDYTKKVNPENAANIVGKVLDAKKTEADKYKELFDKQFADLKNGGVFDELQNTKKVLADYAKANPQAAQDINPDQLLDPKENEYLKALIHSASGTEEELLGKTGKLASQISSIFKKIKINSYSSAVRNMSEYLTRGMQHGVSGEDFIKDMATAYKARGNNYSGMSPEIKDMYMRVVGPSLADAVNPSEFKMKENIFDKLGNGISNIGEKTKIKKAFDKYWQSTQKAFGASDDSLRWNIFKKNITDTTKLPFEEAIKNKKAVEDALHYTDANTITYGHLPVIAKIIKQWQPFFTFQFRAPRQYGKAFYNMPSAVIKAKNSLENISQNNLKDQDTLTKLYYNEKKNPVGSLLSPVGRGNVYLGKFGNDNAEYDTSAMNIFQTNEPPTNLGKGDLSSAVDTAMNYVGLGGGGIAPVAPALIAMQIPKALEGMNPDAKQESLQALSDLVKSASPTEVNNLIYLANTSPAFQRVADRYAKLGRARQSDIFMPGKSTATTPTGIARYVGQKVRYTNIEDIANAINSSYNTPYTVFNNEQNRQITKYRKQGSNEIPEWAGKEAETNTKGIMNKAEKKTALLNMIMKHYSN